MPDECRKTRWIGIILLQRECERRILSSTSTIFGVLPIAIGLGAGAESRRPLGLAVVGGLFFSTFLTLIIVPVVYTLLARFAGDPVKLRVRVQLEGRVPAAPEFAPGGAAAAVSKAAERP